MQVGMIGPGRIGANMVRRLMRGGHPCVVWDVFREAVGEPAGEGAVGAASLADFAAGLSRPRAVWLMIPSARVAGTIDEVAPLLAPGDILIDGGNSYDRDHIDRAEALKEGVSP